ncbi:hypothetical protein [Halobaculum sp. EA56]|uniref:hypothetical protein n=1 Tax=Halobaculum sp. EA56 TaxID=3421648 RepID=UPI003EBEFCCC
MNNPHHRNEAADAAWTDLPSIERTTLYLIARLEHDRRNRTDRPFTHGISYLIPDTDPDLDRYEEALEGLTERGLLTSIDGNYFLTDAGQELLQTEYDRLGRVLDPDSHGARELFPSCPNCGDPVATLSVAGPGSARAGPCGCQLPGPLETDPLTERLGRALHRTADADARYHIRQAMQLAVARSHRYTE